MLLSKTVQVRWVGNTAPHYKEKGYTLTKFFDFFECRVEDLMKTSTVKVEVLCDYCQEEVSLKPYRDYLKMRKEIEKDCCKRRSCMVKKSEEVSLLRYGVKSPNSREEAKQNLREKFQTSTEEVLRIAESKGIKILNIDTYENDRTRLKVICTRHEDMGVQDTCFANIKKNIYCCEYIVKIDGVSGKSKRLTGEEARERFLNAGLTPMFSPEEYTINSEPMPYKCPKHLDLGVQYRTLANVAYAEGCSGCASERRSLAHRNDLERVAQYFIDRDIIVLNLGQYENRESKMDFVCLKHPSHVQVTSVGTLRNTSVPCVHCRADNSALVLTKRLRSSIGSWKKRVEIESEYKCALTGSSEYDIHHIYPFKNILIDTLKELNMPFKTNYSSEEFIAIRDMFVAKHENVEGIALHPVLHSEFHTIFSKANNTKEQIDEFKVMYKNGKFDNLLSEKGVF